MHRTIRLAAAATLVLGVVASSAGAALAATPEIVHGSNRETFPDDFILDLCGIETMTTVTEHWTLWTYADGSQKFQTSRKYVPDDPRIPIEYGSAHVDVRPGWHPDRPRLPDPALRRGGGGIILRDAGYIRFGDPLTVHGPHPSLDLDLAELYCP